MFYKMVYRNDAVSRVLMLVSSKSIVLYIHECSKLLL